MFETIGEWLGGLPTAAVAALGVLLLVQVVLQVYGVVDLVRRDSVPLGKGPWLAIIILGNLLGAVAYLVFSRENAAVDSVAAPETAQRESTLDSLYGDGEEGSES